MGALDLDDPIYDPFRREDQYGVLGRARQTPYETVRLWVLIVVVAPIKFLGCLLCVSACWAVCRFSFLLPKEKRQDALVATCKALVGGCLWSLGSQRRNWNRAEGFEYDAEHTALAQASPDAIPGVIISNHVSWADILVHMEGHFCSFVARSNTQDMPLIGLVSQHLDCIFVHREFARKGEKNIPAKGAATMVKERMEAVVKGQVSAHTRPLLLFPEGTTTNGHCLLPFKTGAFLAGVPVQPYVIRYTWRRVHPAWESVSALWHVALMLANLRHEVTVTELPIYVPNKAEKADPHLFADNVRAAMLRFGNFKPAATSLVECRAYIALLEGGPPPPHSKAGQALAAGQKLPPNLVKTYFPNQAAS